MSTNTTGFRGVSKTTQSSSYSAQISIENKKVHIGCYPTKQEAANAYDNYVISNGLEHTINAS